MGPQEWDPDPVSTLTQRGLQGQPQREDWGSHSRRHREGREGPVPGWSAPAQLEGAVSGSLGVSRLKTA